MPRGVWKQGRPSLEERFWPLVQKQDEGCWLWIGNRVHSGYGRLTYDSKTDRAHRISWRLTYGEIPDGLLVCHRCDNPPCVRPEHLFLGTNKDNMQDMASKHRGVEGDKHWLRKHPERARRGKPFYSGRGEELHNAKLTEEAVRDIRARWVPRKVTYAMLGEEYGVTDMCISAVVRRKTWAHVA
jgi:hypothetical protein